MVRKVAALFTVTLMALLLGGCCWGNPSEKFNVTVALDDSMRAHLQTRKVEVHIVAINDNENERWQNYSMTDYWQPNDKMRESIPTFKMVFDPTNTSPQTLKMDDPIWDKWLANKATHLYVLALLPGMVPDAQGDKDPRRQILPLQCDRWKWGTHDIRLEVKQTGIITITSPLPEDN